MLVKDNQKSTWYGEEITDAQYEEILAMLHNLPVVPKGFGYRLTPALEWELCELPPAEDEEVVDETEEKAKAYDILTGVAE